MIGRGRKPKHFLVGAALSNRIEQLTADERGRFKQRDFVAPLVKYCVSGNYNGKIGIVYGLRSTGKTVGMLQAAEELINRGHKVAYARFNYDEFAMGDANIEIKALAAQGCSHFFIDEATYLEGFLNAVAEWPDAYVPDHKIKIVISGTDSFLLNMARVTSLFHRCEQFSANWCSFDEYKRITGASFEEYKSSGGIFASDGMPEFIQAALVENLLRTMRHCAFDASRPNAYTDRLLDVSAAIVYKVIVSVLKCTAEKSIKRHFAEYANEKNVLDFGEAVSNWTKEDKRDLRKRVAEAMAVYDDFNGIDYPAETVEMLIAFLLQVDCLTEAYSAAANFGGAGVKDALYYFSQAALMSYAAGETVKDALELSDINQAEFERGIHQAAEGFINESVSFAHVLRSAKKSDEVFRYRDEKLREVDIVVKNFADKTVRLIEVKSKGRIDVRTIFANEARHLYDDGVLANLGISDEYAVSRLVVYCGDSKIIEHQKGNLALAGIEDFICHQRDWELFAGQLPRIPRISQIEHPSL
ncbi:MAG: AAA family ATPase [Clostridiales bacterium]|jgi:predicted AAA+ superfamily ATPase|nr:AAA family ATPase [Clostridiales bacterium]